MGIRNEGMIPSNVVHNSSVRKLPHESADLGTLLAGESRIGEITNRTTVLVSERSTGIFEVAKTPFRFGRRFVQRDVDLAEDPRF